LARGSTSAKDAGMKVALYARASTRDQQKLPMQLSAMRTYARRRGWKVVVEEKEVDSGAKSRPTREEILKAARRRDLDTIVVWRLDRWGRFLLDLVGTLQELHSVGVGFVSLAEALATTTPGGRALAGMLAVLPSSSAISCAIG
jgi:putative DNA-invertase from lambdoid prophage Rac